MSHLNSWYKAILRIVLLTAVVLAAPGSNADIRPKKNPNKDVKATVCYASDQLKLSYDNHDHPDVVVFLEWNPNTFRGRLIMARDQNLVKDSSVAGIGCEAMPSCNLDDDGNASALNLSFHGRGDQQMATFQMPRGELFATKDPGESTRYVQVGEAPVEHDVSLKIADDGYCNQFPLSPDGDGDGAAVAAPAAAKATQ